VTLYRAAKRASSVRLPLGEMAWLGGAVIAGGVADYTSRRNSDTRVFMGGRSNARPGDLERPEKPGSVCEFPWGDSRFLRMTVGAPNFYQ